jgi:hypothetical protein
MKKLSFLLVLLAGFQFSFAQTVVVPNVWINEIHYDNVSTDTLEGYEIAGPAGTDLSCYKVYLYNGGVSVGQVYSTDLLTGIIPDQGCGFGAVWFSKPVDGMQNGPNDGIVLEYAPVATGCNVNQVDTILQFLSYEGVLTALTGRAQGLVSTDIGVLETSSTLKQTSLQLGGVGTSYSQFCWQTSREHTHNLFNANQHFCNAPNTSFSFNKSAVTFSEASGLVTLGYVKAQNVFATSTVDVVLKNGNAADINNYTALTLSFQPCGADSLPVSVMITDDALVEGDEVLDFVLRNPSAGALINADSLLALTIIDNDISSATVQFSSATYSVNEGGNSVDLIVTIANPSAVATTVDISVTGGTATNGVDYTFTPSTLTFPASSTAPIPVTINIVNDAIVEGNETIIFTLSNPTNAALGTIASSTLTIVDNDVAQVTMAINNQTQFENIGQINVPVALNLASSNPTSVTVELVPSGTTATSGSDFIFTDTTLTWTPGTSGIKIVSITVINDALYELSETVRLRLTNPTNGAAILDTFFLLTILDNDGLPTGDCSNLFFSEYIEGSSNNKALEIYNPTSSAINLADYRIFKSINGGTSNTVLGLKGTIAPGDVYVLAGAQSDTATKLVADTVVGFLNHNGNDAYALLHLNDTIDVIGQIGVDPGTSWPVGSGSTANNTLVRKYYQYQPENNWSIAAHQWDVYPIDMFDSLGFHHIAPCGTPEPIQPASLRFIGTSASVVEANVVLNVIVETINPSNVLASFTVATDDNASTASEGNQLDFTFANLVTSHGQGIFYDTIPVNIYDDFLIEPTEQIIFRLINVSSNVIVGADSVYTINIIDEDVLTVSFLGAGFGYLETAGEVQVKVVLSTFATDTVKATITLAPGSATKGVDFLFNDTIVVFPPFSSDTQAVLVTILDDNIDEINEQINFLLSNPTAGVQLGITAYTLTIIDDDLPTTITTLSLDNAVRVYPNPVQHILQIKVAEQLEEVKITDLLGNVVVNVGEVNVGVKSLDVTTLPSGIYFLTSKVNNHLLTKRFVKQQ